MSKGSTLLLAALSLTLIGCQDQHQLPRDVISQRYIHKYGYDVSPDEWETQSYPGQVLTTKRNGVSLVTSYEDGVLHGSRTETYPHSQTVRYEETYERGHLKNRIEYNIRGVKQREESFLGENHSIVTSWYPSGTPKSREEMRNGELLNGEYFNGANDIDARIDAGTGERIVRNQNGDILSKEIYRGGEVTYVETYYPNNMPHMATSYKNGKVHGEKKIYSITGEPLAVESWHNGELHGVASYYQNGYKYKEVPYLNGMRSGIERHYIDGETIVEETQWIDDQKHGASVAYYDGIAKTSWYFGGNKVTKQKYETLTEREAYITAMNVR